MEKKQTIEKSLERLEAIVSRLGDEAVSLDESLKLFSEGMKLSQSCRDEIAKAELIIEEHTVAGSGK